MKVRWSYECGLPRREVVADRLRIDLCVGTDGGWEEEEHWGCLELELHIVSYGDP